MQALVYMAQIVEEIIKKITTDAEKVLEEQNKIRKMQKLPEKKRLSDEEIRAVLR
jgi:hypothetical protein